MKFVSTRGQTPALGLADAIAQGLAPDGGLYVPAEMPRVSLTAGATIADTATSLLAPFFAGDRLEAQLAAICHAAFTFDAPVVPVGDESVLELFHGPTAAFKDFGARFLAETLSRDGQGGTVLVATSGDTGAAVAAAFAGRPGFRVVILYPDGRVSPRQAHQLGAFGGNVRALKVRGTFDDCQALCKRAFGDAALSKRHQLRSANSISLGRLLPQMAYYAHTALRTPTSFVVPTGNLGNAQACLWARAVGTPIERVLVATNANSVVAELVNHDRWAPGASKVTLANAMDVGAPSNVERLRKMLPDAASLRAVLYADSIDDETIRETIVETWKAHRYAPCPHTAVGVAALRRLRAQGVTGRFTVAATAHPAKFDSIVEPLIGQAVAPPPALAALLARPAHAEPIDNDYAALVASLED
jgi:threonine synthase